MTKAAPLTWTTKRIRLGDLIEWDKNPVQISEREAKELAKSLEKFEHVLPYVAAAPPNGHKGLPLLDGHQRKMVEITLRKVSPATMVDVRVPSRKLTEKERQEIAIRLRKNVGEFDFDKLANFFEPADLMEWGFSERELLGAGFEFGESKDAEPQIDRAEELQKKWKVKTGDLWQIGNHRLLCGDSTKREDVERVMGGEKADCIWTDPPYGVNYMGGAKEREAIENDDDVTIAAQGIKLSSEFIRLGGVIYTAAPAARLFEFWTLFIDADYHYSTLLVWVKNNMAGGWGDYRGAYENIIYGWKNGASHYWSGARDKSTVFSYDKPASSVEHPTMKPVELVQEHISNSTIAGEAVYEPFCGSGTTIVACENLGRKCRAIEISPAYCAVTLERMFQAFPGIEIKRLNGK